MLGIIVLELLKSHFGMSFENTKNTDQGSWEGRHQRGDIPGTSVGVSPLSLQHSDRNSNRLRD